MKDHKFDRRLELETFMHFAFGIWPQISTGFANDLQRRCTKCILTESAAFLNNQGICQFCLEFKHTGDGSKVIATRHQDLADLKHKFDRILNAYAGGPGRKYDAVVLYSGGKDSMYLVYQLQHNYPKLRILPVLIDNGFMSEVAIDNAYYGARKLNIELLRYTPEPELFRKTFRHAFLNLNEGGCYTTVDRMDGDLVFDIGRNIASNLNAPLLFAGLSVEQLDIIMHLHHFESPRDTEELPRLTSAGFPLSKLYSKDELQKYWWNGSRGGEQLVPRVLYPFYVWRPPEKDIVQFIKAKCLIKAGQENPLVTNNHTIPVMLAVDYAKMGYSGFEPEFASMIRERKSERGVWLNLFQAIEFLTNQGKFLPRSIASTLERLGLCDGDVGIPSLDLESDIIMEYTCAKSA